METFFGCTREGIMRTQVMLNSQDEEVVPAFRGGAVGKTSTIHESSVGRIASGCVTFGGWTVGCTFNEPSLDFTRYTSRVVIMETILNLCIFCVEISDIRAHTLNTINSITG